MSRYDVELTTRADKELDKLARSQPRDAEAIEDALVQLGLDPRRHGCIPLTGMPGVMRVRVGNYRICYQIHDGRLVVLVIVISKRGDVYQQVKRALGR